MNEFASLTFALLAGILLGGFFFGGLWWTIQKGLTSNHPALWLFSSTMLRIGITLTTFYFVSLGDWRRLLTCLLGFFVARLLVTRIIHHTREETDAP